jgi:hypothetical protein
MRAQGSTHHRQPSGGSGTWAKVPGDVLNLPVTRQELRAFIALSLFANGTRQAWPSEETLAERVGVSRWRIRQLLVGLQDHGLITRLARRRATEPYRYLIAPLPVGRSEPAIDELPVGRPEAANVLAGFARLVGRSEPAMNRRTDQKNRRPAAGDSAGASPARIPDTPEEIEDRRRRALEAKAALVARGGS